jgi:nitrogen regulatory protein P-II 1
MSMVLFVLHDPEKLQQVLSAWDGCGISGATVLYNTGIGRLRQNGGLRDDLPLIPSLSDFFDSPENHGQTLFTITDDDSLIPALIEATERVVGSLNQPGNGILAVFPTSQIRGLIKRDKSSG